MSSPRHLARAAAVLTALALTACSGGTAGTTDATSAAASATPMASATPSVPATPAAPTQVTAEVTKPQVDKRSVKTYGTTRVARAWKLSTDLGEQYAFNSALMTKPMSSLGPGDFTDLRAAMTGAARKDWDKIIAGLPGIESFQDANALATIGVNINGNRLRSVDPVTDFSIVGAVVTSKDGTLVTSQVQSAVLHLVNSTGDPVRFTSTKEVTYYLTQAKGTWKIKSWEATANADEVASDR